MNDPLTSIAFSVSSGKGIYALLLGSGLSSAAGILTGWEITLDLIRKGAAASGEECGTDPAGWYKTKTGHDADYSELLDGLAQTPADRMNLLSSYFEPTADDLEKGLKTPTQAHKSLARLVAKGYVRVILTTNFDRLLERAIETEGISPTIISTADAAKGALPLAHARCTVIKLHGDYRDTRIKNTAPELDAYEPEMDRLLDRVLDEYGLIVCGWSASWDKALCRAVLRCPNRRFTTFWARRTHLSHEASALVSHKQATQLEIDSANAFFSSLEEKVDAIERYSKPHPASAQLAVVSLKRYIAEDRYRIELRDLVATETERVFKNLSSLPVSGWNLTVEQIFERMKLYESASEILISLLAHGTHWGRSEHQRFWNDALTRIAMLKALTSGNSYLPSLQIYPACLSFYSSGLGAIAGNNYETLKRICRDIFTEQNGQEIPLIRVVLPTFVLEYQVAQQLPGYESHHTPINDRVFDVLREALREYLPGDAEYADAFDRFEYLAALVHLDLRLSSASGIAWAPPGCFAWRRHLQHKSIVDRISEDANKHGENWIAIRSGLFPSLSRFKELEATYREQILSRLNWF